MMALWLWWSRSLGWWSTLTRHRLCAGVTADPFFFCFLQYWFGRLRNWSFLLPVCTTGYWPSYNVPFHKKIYTLSGYGQMWEKYGEEFSYDLCARAKIFRRDQADVKDLDSLKHIMRSNGVWLCLILLRVYDPHSAGSPYQLHPAFLIFPQVWFFCFSPTMIHI